MGPVILGISGASGAIYAKEIFDRLLDAGVETQVIVTDTAEHILDAELDLSMEYFQNKPGAALLDNARFNVPAASGSFLTRGMVVVPCSMGCLGRIAGGISSDLLERIADVHLKERRKLIIVPRETPLSDIHLENMLRVSRAGAVVLPAMPAFTHRPSGVEDLAAFIAGRVFDHLGIPQNFTPRYLG